MKQYLYIFFFIVAFSFLIIFDSYKFYRTDKYFKIHFLNVAQGDSTLIRTPTSCNILIDGGGYNYLIDTLHNYLPPLNLKIDYLILSHPHLDHMGGLLQLLEKYPVGTVFITGVKYQSQIYDEFIKIIKENNINIEFVISKSVYELCELKFNFIYPNRSLIGEEFQNVNNSSIVFYVNVRGVKLWFGGDAELEEEQYLYDLLEGVDIDIYKASHHGSKTSNSERLLKMITPKIMVISAGKNNTYNHPHFETIQTANNLGIEIYRTDQNGTVTFLLSAE